jgi:hypothetical protein
MHLTGMGNSSVQRPLVAAGHISLLAWLLMPLMLMLLKERVWCQKELMPQKGRLLPLNLQQ